MCVCLVVSNCLWPKDCSPPGSSVHGIVQARILEGVSRPSSRGYSSNSYVPCISRGVLYHRATRGSPGFFPILFIFFLLQLVVENLSHPLTWEISEWEFVNDTDLHVALGFHFWVHLSWPFLCARDSNLCSTSCPSVPSPLKLKTLEWPAKCFVNWKVSQGSQFSHSPAYWWNCFSNLVLHLLGSAWCLKTWQNSRVKERKKKTNLWW